MKKTYLCSPKSGKDAISFSLTDRGVLFELYLEYFNHHREMLIPYEDLKVMVNYLYKLTTLAQYTILPELIHHLNKKYNKNVTMLWIHNDITFTIFTNDHFYVKARLSKNTLKAIYSDLNHSCTTLWDAV